MKKLILTLFFPLSLLAQPQQGGGPFPNPSNGGGSTNQPFGATNTIVMAIDGDSWSDPVFCVPPWADVVRNRYFTNLTRLAYWTNIALAGSSTVDVSNRVVQLTNVSLRLSSTNVGFYVAIAGINDSISGILSTSPSATLATNSFLYMSNASFRMRALGFKTIWATVPMLGATPPSVISYGQKDFCNVYNNLVISHKELYDGLVDLAKMFPNRLNSLTISNADSLHPTIYGISNLVSRAIANEVSRIMRTVPGEPPSATLGDMRVGMNLDSQTNIVFTWDTTDGTAIQLTNFVDGANCPMIRFGEHSYGACQIFDADCYDAGRRTNRMRMDFQNTSDSRSDANRLRIRMLEQPNFGTVNGTWTFTELGNFTCSSNIIANSYVSSATNRVAITATGYTNTLTVSGVQVDADVYFHSATGTTVSDSAGTVMYTYTTLVTQDTYVHLKPNWRLIGTSMAGTAIAH